MIELIAHNLAPIMFASLVVFLLLGYPVAFSLAANGLIFFVVGVELAPYSQSSTLDWPLLGLTIARILDVMRNDTLLAIPFFPHDVKNAPNGQAKKRPVQRDRLRVWRKLHPHDKENQA